MLKEKSIILFQGDSITDCGRDRNDKFGLGSGYPIKIKVFFDTFFANKGYTVINKGISGDTTENLKERWDEDAINIKSDVLSILIGINDTWRRYDSGIITTADIFEENYRYILDKSLKANPDLKIILIEPFLIDSDPQKLCWREEDLNLKRYIVNKLAREYKTLLLSAESLFAKASINIEPSFFSVDGVHPSDAGHSLLALEWLKTTGFIK